MAQFYNSNVSCVIYGSEQVLTINPLLQYSLERNTILLQEQVLQHSLHLEDLVCCDLVRKNIVREKGIKRKDAIYQLCDFFSLFYLSFIDRAEVEHQYWSHHINTSEVNSWMGLAYERICMAHIQQIKHSLRIDAISTLSYSWRSKTSTPSAQIDIIIERADKIVNVCEVKYSQTEYVLDKEEYDKMIRRRNAFIQETGLRHTPWLTMITTEGVARGKYSEMIQSQLRLDDLFV